MLYSITLPLFELWRDWHPYLEASVLVSVEHTPAMLHCSNAECAVMEGRFYLASVHGPVLASSGPPRTSGVA